MSDSQPQHAEDLPNLDRIRQLAQLMEEHDLSEVDLRQSDQRIRLRRGAISEVTRRGSSAPPAESRAETKTDDPPARADSPESANVSFIKSPMVGTFYSRANPEAEPYVKVGDHIGPDTVVCIIEAMKVFNEIPAEVSGRVIGVLAENEEPVEFGKPLFKIDTGG